MQQQFIDIIRDMLWNSKLTDKEILEKVKSEGCQESDSKIIDEIESRSIDIAIAQNMEID